MFGSLVLSPLRRLTRAVRTTRRTVERIPDVLDAILVLPELSRRLEAIAFSTATLPEMHAELRRVHGDTAVLPHIDETLLRMAVLLDRVDTNTAAVTDLAEIALPLRGAALRVGRAADRWPRRSLSASARTGDGG